MQYQIHKNKTQICTIYKICINVKYIYTIKINGQNNNKKRRNNWK